MKLLFVHDTIVKEDDEGNLYTSGSYNQAVWERYLSLSKKISVIARKDNEIYKKDFAEKNFNFMDKEMINFIPIPNSSRSLKDFLSLSIHINKRKIIKENVISADYIIARLPSTSGSLAVKYAKKNNKPYLIEVVGCPWDSLWNYNFKGKLIAPLKTLELKEIAKNAPYALYVTNEFLQHRYPTNGYSIGCSDVIIENNSEDVLNNRIEKINKYNSINGLKIGTIGAVDVKYKGQGYVIKLLEKLKEHGIYLEYILAGGGNPEALIEYSKKCGVENQVKFLGSIPHYEISKYLKEIDIYIQPSYQEGLPRSMVEAMSVGCPILGSKVGGIPELISESMQFKKGNIEELYDIMVSLSKEKLKTEAKNNFNKSLLYNYETLNKKRIDFYNLFIERGI